MQLQISWGGIEMQMEMFWLRNAFELISNVLTFSFIWSNTVFIGWLLFRRPGLLYNISI